MIPLKKDDTLEKWFSARAVPLPPCQGPCEQAWAHFWFPQAAGGGAIVTLWAEVGDAAEPPAVHRTALYSHQILSPSCQ